MYNPLEIAVFKNIKTKIFTLLRKEKKNANINLYNVA